VLSLNSISAVKEIYASGRANTQKGGGLYTTIQAGSGGSSTHSEIDRTKHAARRRILGHAFTDNALRDAEPLILENVKIWCRQLGDGEKNPDGWTMAKDVNEWNTYLGYDIMGVVAFGKGFHCLLEEDHRYVPELLKASNKFIYHVSGAPTNQI
jgi:cytochrome P450